MKNIATSIAAVSCLLVSHTAFALDSETLAIHPMPQQVACGAAAVHVDEAPIKVELCVLRGNFSHDQYGVKFDGRVVLQGIDDQTTRGISATYRKKDVRLQCTPQEIRGNASEEEVRTAMPSYSEAKVKEIVELMKGSSMGIEAARLCTIDLDKSTILKAQVLFD